MQHPSDRTPDTALYRIAARGRIGAGAAPPRCDVSFVSKV